MEDRIRGAFDAVRADRALLDGTAQYLRAQRDRAPAKKRFPLRLAAAAAAVVLVAGLFSYNVYATPYTYVSIDVNPSVELTLNRMDRVIASAAFNEDGERVLQEVRLQGKPYGDAVELLMQSIGQEGYLTGEPLVAVSVQTADENRQQTICDTLRQGIDGNLHTAQVEVRPVSAEVRETAHGHHMSPARYLAMQELLEVDGDATWETYGGASIGQIRERTRQCQEAHGSGENAQPHGQSGNGGNGGQGQGHGHRVGH